MIINSITALSYDTRSCEFAGGWSLIDDRGFFEFYFENRLVYVIDRKFRDKLINTYMRDYYR